MNSRKQVNVSTVAGNGESLKWRVKYRNWRIPDFTFAALSLVYLKPCVVLFCTLRVANWSASSVSKMVV